MTHYKKWKIDEADDLPLAVIEDTADGYGICELEAGVDRMANAKLIAAAPDLLELTEAFFEWHANHFEDFDDDVNGELLCLSQMAEFAINRVITD